MAAVLAKIGEALFAYHTARGPIEVHGHTLPRKIFLLTGFASGTFANLFDGSNMLEPIPLERRKPPSAVFGDRLIWPGANKLLELKIN